MSSFAKGFGLSAGAMVAIAIVGIIVLCVCLFCLGLAILPEGVMENAVESVQ